MFRCCFTFLCNIKLQKNEWIFLRELPIPRLNECNLIAADGKIYLVHGTVAPDMEQLLELMAVMPLFRNLVNDGDGFMTITQYCPQSDSLRDVEQDEELPYNEIRVSDNKVFRITEDDEDEDDREIKILDLAINEHFWKVINDANCCNFEHSFKSVTVNDNTFVFGSTTDTVCVYSRAKGKDKARIAT